MSKLRQSQARTPKTTKGSAGSRFSITSICLPVTLKFTRFSTWGKNRSLALRTVFKALVSCIPSSQGLKAAVLASPVGMYSFCFPAIAAKRLSSWEMGHFFTARSPFHGPRRAPGHRSGSSSAADGSPCPRRPDSRRTARWCPWWTSGSAGAAGYAGGRPGSTLRSRCSGPPRGKPG